MAETSRNLDAFNNTSTGLFRSTGAEFITAQALRDFVFSVNALIGPEVVVVVTTTLAAGQRAVCSGTGANYSVTLPPVAAAGGKLVGVRITRTTTVVITIDGNGSETINGSLTLPLDAGESVLLYCDGTEWVIVDFYQVLATVALSGSYNSLSDKPTIPSTKGDIGLGNVDNTSDADKPVSSAQATAIAAKLSAASPVMTGTVVVRQTGGTAGTDEGRLQHDGSNFLIEGMDNVTRFVLPNTGSTEWKFCKRTGASSFSDVVRIYHDGRCMFNSFWMGGEFSLDSINVNATAISLANTRRIDGRAGNWSDAYDVCFLRLGPGLWRAAGASTTSPGNFANGFSDSINASAGTDFATAIALSHGTNRITTAGHVKLPAGVASAEFTTKVINSGAANVTVWDSAGGTSKTIAAGEIGYFLQVGTSTFYAHKATLI
jgi:hypothetical protein